MGILHPDEIREMTKEEIEDELDDLQTELLTEKSIISAGGAPENPGRIREIRRAIARIKTVRRERELEGEE